jgi:hypothetical protein
MEIGETPAETPSIRIHDIVHVALPIEIDRARIVAGDAREAHFVEQRPERFRLRMGEFDKFEPVGSGRIIDADFGGRRVM